MTTLPDFLIIPTILLTDENIQPLDREVFGIIYWTTKLKNEKCTMTNRTIADLLRAKPSSVSHAVNRLVLGKYVSSVINPKTHQRKELRPLISFSAISENNENYNPSSKKQGFEDEVLTLAQKSYPLAQKSEGVSSVEHDTTNKNINKNNKEDKYINIFANKKENAGAEKTTGSSLFDQQIDKQIIAYCQREQKLDKGFVNYASQLVALKKIRSARYTTDDIYFVINEMVADPYWSTRPFDLFKVSNQMHYFLNRTVYFDQKKGGGSRNGRLF